MAKDAVPKKRGPKTDVLEALLKRVDGLERRLKDEQRSNASTTETHVEEVANVEEVDTEPRLPIIETDTLDSAAVFSPTPIRRVTFSWLQRCDH